MIALQVRAMTNSEHTFNKLRNGAEEAWGSEEYEAGHGARMLGVPECLTATPCWRAGWQEADREISGAAVSEKRHAVAGMSTLWSPFESGGHARTRGLPFDELCSDSWKRSWIQADIALGILDSQRSA